MEISETIERRGEDIENEVEVLKSRLSAVQEISQALATPLPLEVLLNVVMDKITRLMRAERSTLFMLNPDSGVLTSTVAQTDSDTPLKIRLQLGEGIAGWVAMTGETINMKDAYQDDRFKKEVDEDTGFKTESILCKPMWNLQGATIGVIQVLNKRGGYFTQDDDELLAALASQAAMSIENANMYNRLRERNRELTSAKRQLTKKMEDREVLLAVERVVSGQFMLDDILDQVLEELLDAIPSQAGSILLGEGGEDALTFRSSSGPSGPALEHFSVPKGTGLVGWCAANGKPLLSNDAANDPRHARKVARDLGLTVKSALCVPIFSGDESIGALQLINCRKPQGKYDEEDLQLLTLISGQLTRAISASNARNAHLNENRLAAIGQSMSTILHDFRTPMTIISGYIQLLEHERSESDRESYGGIIRDQIKYMNGMVEELLAFARGEVTLLVTKHFLNDYFSKIEEEFAAQVKGRNLEVEFDIQDRGYAFFDGSKIRRCIGNLLRNAREAMEESDTKTITVRVTGDESEVRFAVSDTGPGVPDRIRDKLFQEFVTHGKANGTGLGLAIVDRVVKEHGGKIIVESEPGAGSCFTMVLPRESRQEENQ